MEKNRISEFLESIDSETWNCVYQVNGMTLLTTKEYDYRYEEKVNLQTQLKKQQEIIDKAKEKLKQGITFCENDSQGIYNKCNIAINREKEILQILERG